MSKRTFKEIMKDNWIYIAGGGVALALGCVAGISYNMGHSKGWGAGYTKGMSDGIDSMAVVAVGCNICDDGVTPKVAFCHKSGYESFLPFDAQTFTDLADAMKKTADGLGSKPE